MLDNSKSIGFCSSCGARLTITSKQESNNTTSKEQLLSNYLQMALSAKKANNHAQCEMYCNIIIESDISNSAAWALKATAAGWQSTLANLRIDEMIEYYGNAISYAKSNEEISSIQKAAKEDLKYITEALFEKEMGVFEKFPDADCANAIINHYTYVINAAKKLTLKINFPVNHDELFAPSTTHIHNGAVAAHKRARKEYVDDNNGYPGEYTFKNYLECCENILKVYTILVVMYGNDYTNINIVYDNMINMHKLLMDSCSYARRYIGAGEWGYYVDLSLNETSKARHRKEISDLTAKKAENERKKRAEEDKARRQRVDAYWNSHPNKKTELLRDKDRVSAELKALEKDLAGIEKDKAFIDLKNEINKLTIDKQALGALSLRTKKDLDNKISEKEKELSNMLADRKKALEDQISIKKRRLGYIDNDLTKDRIQAEIDSADSPKPSVSVSTSSASNDQSLSYAPSYSAGDSTKTPISNMPSSRTVSVKAESISSGQVSNNTPKASGKVFEEVDLSSFGEHVWHPVGDGSHEFRVFGFEEGLLRKVKIEIRESDSKRILHSAGCILSINNVSSSYKITTDYVIKDIKLWPGNRVSCVLIFNLLANGKKVKETSCQISTNISDEKESKAEIQHKALIVPESTESIANKAYMGSNIESVEFPSSLKQIGGYSFSNCRNLSKVVFNNGLESIGFAAFSKCPCLKEVFLPDSISKIHRAAFVIDEDHLTMCTESQVCFHLSSTLAIKLLGEEEKDNYTALYARCFVIDGKRYKNLQAYGQTLKRETPQREQSKQKKKEIPQQSKENNERDISSGESVWHFTPDGQYQFRLYGFVGNNNPIKIQFRKSLSQKIVGSSQDPIKISEINGRNDFILTTDYKVDKIEKDKDGGFKFDWYINIIMDGKKCSEDSIRLTFPSLSDYIHDESTKKCAPSSKEDNTRTLDVGTSSVIKKKQYMGDTDPRPLVIPEGVSRICEAAFYNSQMVSVKLPKSLRTLETNAFGCCRHLKSIEIQDGLAEIQSAVFIDCPLLTDIWLPDSLKIIDQRAFVSNDYDGSIIKVHISGKLAEYLMQYNYNDYGFEIDMFVKKYVIDGIEYCSFDDYRKNRM